MAEGEGGYSVGSAFLQILPSFKGIAQQIEAEAAKWGRSAGAKFSNTFNDEVRRRTNNAPLGPSDPDSTKQGAKSGGKFADGFRAKVEAALRALPDIQIGAATTEAEQKLRDLHVQLEELSKKTIGVDIDEGEALAELDRLKAELDELGAKSPSVRVQTDTAAASAKLAEIQAQVAALSDSDPEVDVSDGGSVSALDGQVVGLSTLLIGLVPLAGPVGAALAAAFIGAGAALGALVGGLGVLALVMSGVSKTVGLLNQQQKDQASVGGAAVSSMNAQAGAAAQLTRAEAALKNARAQAADEAITSAEQVKQARRSLDDTLSSAFEQEISDREKVKQAIRDVAAAEQQAAQQQISDARDVVNAEHDLAQAAQSSASAQQQLNDAREQAARDLESYADNAVDSNLNLQQSQIDLTNAQSQYQSDLADPTVTPLQLQQDALNVAKAQQSVVEAQQRLAQATEDNNKAQAAGVDGAPAVISAQQGLAAALYAQQQAAQALDDAQTKQAQDAAAGNAAINKAEAALAAARLTRAQNEIARAEQIADAEQKVTDALRAQANQKRQSAFSVSSARAGVAGAKRAVAGAGAAGGGGAALAGVDEQLANTNPAVLAFAKFVQATLVPALHKLQGIAAAGLLPGVEKGFEAFLPVLPLLTGFVGSLAKTMGDLFTQAGKALASPFWISFFGYVARSAGPILTTFAKIIGNLAMGFAGLMQTFAPVTTAIGAGLLRLAQGFANFAQGKGSDTITAFLLYVRKEGPAVATMFGRLAVLVGHLIVALAPLGDVLVKVISGVAGMLDKLSGFNLLAIFAVLAAAIGGLALALGGIPVAVVAFGVALVALAGLVADTWTSIEQAFTSAWTWIKSAWSTLWAGVKSYIVSPVKSAYDAVVGFFGKGGKMQAAFGAIWNWVDQTWSSTWSGTKKIFVQPFEDAYGAVAGFFGKGGGFRNALNDVWSWISGAFSTLWGGVKKIITEPFTAAKNGVETAFDNIVSFIEGMPKKIAKAAVGMWGGIVDAFRAAINEVIGWWNGLSFSLDIPSNTITKLLHIAGDGFTISTPNIQPLADGGMTTGPAIKLLGDNPGGREVALPLGSSQTTDALAVALGKAIDSRPTPVTAFDSGGYLPTGFSTVFNGTGAPEPVFAPGQLAALSTRSQVAFPDQVTLVDQDGSILAHARVVAHGAITDRAFAAQQDQRARRPGTTADLLVKNGPR